MENMVTSSVATAFAGIRLNVSFVFSCHPID